MKNIFFRGAILSSRWALCGFILGCVWLLGLGNLEAVTETTLGGGDPHVSPKYLGYRDGDTLHNALFHTPCGLAIDSTGNYLFVADRDNNAIRYLDLVAGQTWTFAVANTNLLSKPVGVLVDEGYNVYVLNYGAGNNGSVVTFDNFGDVVTTNAVGLTNACGITMDGLGNLYVTVQGNTIIKITPANVKTTVATIPTAGTALQGIVFKHNGLLAACDAGRNGIYLINPTTGLVTTNAGFHGRGDFPTNSNDIASSSTAKFFQPTGIAETGDGTMLVTDFGNNRVKVVFASGVVTNLYGVVSNFWGGSFKGWYDGSVFVPDSVAPNVQSRVPFGVAFGPDGTVYTSEDYYHLIRKTTGAGFVQPPPAPPAAPVITSVLTNYGTVTLNWSASATATSYNVKRSTSVGGPFTTIANTSSTSYTDTSVINGTTYYYVVSALNAGGEGSNSVAVIAQPPFPPVTDPQIGYVDFPATANPQYSSVFHPISTFDFNNDALLIIKGAPGSGTHYTYGYTTNAALVTDPTPGDASVQSDYQDGLSPSDVSKYVVSQVAPSLTIKAMASQGGRPNSAVVQAVVQFIVGNPNITGNNAAQFAISDITANAHLYYTLDGSDPSRSNPNAVDLGTVATPTNVWTVSLGIQSNAVFKVQAFRDNYQPSTIITNLFSITNFVANTISFGFASGEASSDFVGSPGETFYAPVTLTTLPGTKIYSLQFGITVTNGGIATNAGPIIAPNQYFFESMLEKPDPANQGFYLTIPPEMFINYTTNIVTVGTTTVTNYVPNFTNLEFYTSSSGFLAVGWLERAGKTNLYSTAAQTLTTYSQAHDDLFPNGFQPNGTVLGGYAFQIPPNAALGQQYQIQIGRPSATDDGVGAPGSSVYIAAPTNGAPAGGSMNSVKVVTAGQRKYIAGSVYPFRWFNAGDFGSSNIVNADVEQVFQSAIYSLNYPPPGSDFFDAMDSCGYYYVDNGNGYLENSFIPADTSVLFDGNDTSINQIAFGDGILDVCDVYVTYRRSQDSSLTWFRRYWNNGHLVADTGAPNVPSQFALKSKASSAQPKIVSIGSSSSSQVNFAAGDIQGSAGQVVQIPINATIYGNYPLRMLMLNLTVEPLDGSPALTGPVQFTQIAPLGVPYTTDSKGNGNYSSVWLNNTNGLTGTVTIGLLTVTIPAGASANAAYAVHFDHASASPNGLASFPKKTFTGLITLSSRTNSTYGDGIPDSWRLRWFGTVYNYLSVSNACASGDGVNNFKKFVAGVDPNVANDFPSVNAKTPVPAGSTSAIYWPSISGKQYAIERSPTLFPGNWTSIVTNTGTGTDMEFDDSASGQSQYYRVRILP